MLDEGEDVAEDLAGMVFVGQAVDHRHARDAGEALDDLLSERADHHDVDHARHHLRHVFDRLAAPELRVACVQVDRRAAELVHAGLERQARASAGLLEDHRQRAVFERPVAPIGLELALDPGRAREQVFVLFPAEVEERQVVPGRSHVVACAGMHRYRARNLRISGDSIDTIWSAWSSEMTSGGSMRTMLS